MGKIDLNKMGAGSACWVGFSSIEALDSTFIKRLYNYFGDIESAWNASGRDLENIDELNINQAKKFLAAREKINLDKVVDEVMQRGVKYLTFEDENYPRLLKQISNPPVVLYYKGDLDVCNLDKTLAVVGSRRATTNARKDLAKIISGLGNTDICIVSGLASGIDTVAHESALENNLKTIGVIASGFDFTYPAANRDLYKRIENGNGAVITEYYPTFEPLPFRFLQRNRIVSGLSYGTLVAEASLKSGALTTANLTLEQGRELMCMPGLISNPNTEGIYKLLKTGATLATCAEDVLNAMNWEVQAKQLPLAADLSEDEKKILSAVEIEPAGVDEILAKTGIKLNDLLTHLTTMELRGIIEKVDGDRYRGS
jgi:DNA processing protein